MFRHLHRFRSRFRFFNAFIKFFTTLKVLYLLLFYNKQTKKRLDEDFKRL
jgi:hypothetical protein